MSSLVARPGSRGGRAHRLRAAVAVSLAVTLALVLAPSTTASVAAGSPAAPTPADGALHAAASAIEPSTASPADVSAEAVTGATYRAISPVRVLDTRYGVGASAFTPYASQDVRVTTDAVLAAAGVNADQVTAVVLNVTSVGASGESWVSVWAAGQPWPGASNLNISRAGQTIPNVVTSPVAGGAVAMMAVADMQLIADVQGVYVTGGGNVTGRLQTLPVTRVYDTRSAGNPLLPGEERVVDVRGAGVPSDAAAAVLTITSVISPDQQFLVVWPAGRARPLASNLNVEYRSQTVANQVISGLDAGQVKIYGTAGGDVLVDVAGYYTGAGAGVGTDGLFNAVTPTRLIDTRDRGLRLWPGETVDVPVAGRATIPATGVSAVALNVTATQADAGGYVTVWGAGTARPGTSVLNPEFDGQTVPDHVVTPVSADGFALYSALATHLLADVAGYFTGTPQVGNGAGTGMAPASGPHAFLYTYGGTIARWNPCASLTYAVNDDRAGPGQRALLDSVIAEAEAATGIDLVYRGETSAGLDGTPPSWAKAVLGFSDGSATPSLSGGVVGIGGGSYSPGSVIADGRVVSGFALFLNSYGNTLRQRELMLHEITHMLGLDHVGDDGQVMYPYVVPLSTYGGGDRAGLWRVGRTQGCLGLLSSDVGAADADGPAPLLSTWSVDRAGEAEPSH